MSGSLRKNESEGHACRARWDEIDKRTCESGPDERVPPKGSGPDKQVPPKQVPPESEYT